MTVEQEVDNSNTEQSSPDHASAETKRYKTKRVRTIKTKRIDQTALEIENRQLLAVNEYLCKQLQKLELTSKKFTKNDEELNKKMRIPAKQRNRLTESEELEMLGGIQIIRSKSRKPYKPHVIVPECERRYGGILMLKNCYRGDVLHSNLMIRNDLKDKVRMHRLHPRKRIMQSITNTRSINWNYSCIVLMTCVHDLYDDVEGSGSEYIEDISAMCDDIFEMYGKLMPIVISGVTTLSQSGNILRRIKEYNTAVEDYCKSNNVCHYVDVSDINVDPYKGYESDDSSMQALRGALIDVIAPISAAYKLKD